MGKLNRNKENNAMVQHAVDEIILQENNTLSAKDKSNYNIDSVINEDDLYDIDNTIIEKNKE